MRPPGVAAAEDLLDQAARRTARAAAHPLVPSCPDSASSGAPQFPRPAGSRRAPEARSITPRRPGCSRRAGAASALPGSGHFGRVALPFGLQHHRPPMGEKPRPAVQSARCPAVIRPVVAADGGIERTAVSAAERGPHLVGEADLAVGPARGCCPDATLPRADSKRWQPSRGRQASVKIPGHVHFCGNVHTDHADCSRTEGRIRCTGARGTRTQRSNRERT